MLGRVDFRKDERERERNEKGQRFEECLVGRGIGENDSGPRVFSS